MNKKLIAAAFVLTLLVLLGLACDSTPIEQAAEQAVEDAAAMAVDAAEQAVEDAVQDARQQVETEASNLIERAVDRIDQGINYLARLAVLDDVVGDDAVDWWYNNDLRGALDNALTAYQLTHQVFGTSGSPIAAIIGIPSTYASASRCIKDRDRYGIRPCVEAGIDVAGMVVPPLATAVGGPIAGLLAVGFVAVAELATPIVMNFFSK